MKTRWTKVAAIGWMIAAFVIILLVPVTGAQAQKYENYRVDGQKLTDQEKYVLAQSEKGEIADLLEKFVLPLIPEQDRRERAGKLGLAGYMEQLDAGEKEAYLKSYPYRFRTRPRFLEILLTEGFPGCKMRPHEEAFLMSYGDGLRIRAKFLEILLTEGFPGFKIHRHGVRIANAIIKESLDFDGAEVDHEFWLCGSRLEGEANFMDSSFKKNILLSGVQFLGEANFERIKVGKSLFLRDAYFHGPIIFRIADIGGNFEADGAKFLNEKAEADFTSMKVNNCAFFQKAEFQGPVNFVSADIKGSFEARGAKFLNKEQTANFNSMKVEKAAFFREAKFRGPVDFAGAKIGGYFVADGAQFLNDKEKASFNALKVEQHAFFKKATFQGPVNFVSAVIKGNFEGDGAHFLNENQEATFGGMKVGGNAFFEEAKFQGPVNFVTADIGGQFSADGAKFLNQGENTFEGIKIGQVAFFRNVILNGKVFFSYGNFLDLRIHGSKETGGKAKEENKGLIRLSLEGTKVQRDLEIKNMNIGELKATNCQVKGTATFDKVEWPGKDKVHLTGLSCQSMDMRQYPVTSCWDKVTTRLPTWLCPRHPLLYWIDNSDFDTRNYLHLEAFFQRTGKKDLADQAYIKMKQRESGLDSWWGWLNPWKWPKLLFWDLPVGYGRKPLRILGFALLFIGFGAWFFDPKYLIHVRWPKKSKFYGVLGRLALSCDICTPSLLNLGMEKDWSPPRISGRMKIFIFLYGLIGRIFIAVFFLGVWEKFK